MLKINSQMIKAGAEALMSDPDMDLSQATAEYWAEEVISSALLAHFDKIPFVATPLMVEAGAEVLADLSGEASRARTVEAIWAAMALAYQENKDER